MFNVISGGQEGQIPANVQNDMNAFWSLTTLVSMNDCLARVSESTQFDEVSAVIDKVEHKIFDKSDMANPTRIVDLSELNVCVKLLEKYNSTGELEYWNEFSRLFSKIG